MGACLSLNIAVAVSRVCVAVNAAFSRSICLIELLINKGYKLVEQGVWYQDSRVEGVNSRMSEVDSLIRRIERGVCSIFVL